MNPHPLPTGFSGRECLTGHRRPSSHQAKTHANRLSRACLNPKTSGRTAGHWRDFKPDFYSSSRSKAGHMDSSQLPFGLTARAGESTRGSRSRISPVSLTLRQGEGRPKNRTSKTVVGRLHRPTWATRLHLSRGGKCVTSYGE